MKSYLIHKITADSDWDNLPILNIDTLYLQTPDTIKAYGQIGYTDEALHVHLWTEETNYRAVETGYVGMPCEDSCLEFFFTTDPAEPRYINLEFNSNGCAYLGIGNNAADPSLVRMVVDETIPFSPVIHRYDWGWEIYYQIPYSFVRYFFPDFQPVKGKQIHANVYKCADLSEPPHYLAWNPVPGEPLSFHRRNHFGLMQFD